MRTGTLKNLTTLLWFVSGLCAVIVTVWCTSRVPIDFDQAFNLQIAKSLATHFTYSSTYQPPTIYSPQVTTNGPIQYFAAMIFALGGNVDAVMTVTTTTAMALFVLGLFLLRPYLAALALLFQCAWPVFLVTSDAFVGEVWGTAFVLLGLAALRRPFDPFALTTLPRKPFFFIAGGCFAVAISTKLLLLFAILPLLFALGYQVANNARRNENLLAKLASATLFTAILSGFSVALFVAQFAFSILHSSGFNVGAIFGALPAFIAAHIGQAQGRHVSIASALQSVHAFTSPVILMLCLLSVIALLAANLSYAFFIAVVLALFFYYGMSERELLPMFSLLIILGTLEGEHLLVRLTGLVKLPVSFARTAAACAFLAFLWVQCAVTDSNGVRLHLAARNQDTQRAYTLQCCSPDYHYKPALIKALRSQRYILTSGWWQFPEISIRRGLQFYDRTAPQNATLPKRDAALLFDATNHTLPITSRAENCASLIYVDGPLTLCRVRKDRPLAFQPPVK